MASIDLITMIGNLSQSLFAVQSLITGLSYTLGVLFIMNGFFKLKELTGGSGSHTSPGVGLAHIAGGAALLYLPTMLEVLSNTTFGTTSLLQYTHYNPYNIYSSMRLLIQTSGLIWFVRGCVLLVHSSQSGGGQEGAKNLGPKGLAFMAAGIFAMNFEGTIAMLNYVMTELMSWFGKTPTQ